MKLLDGKVALITGANRGIGKSIALKFAAHGAHVAFSDIAYNDDSKQLEDELKAFGVNAKGYASDASSFADAEKLVNDVTNDFGKIEILVNNAGITRDNLLIRMKEEDWDLVLTINLKSAFLCCKEAARTMMKARSGKIINIASIVGINGNAGQANYSASKAGLIGLTKTLAKELASRNIQVNAIAPGFIRTAMTDKIPEAEKEKLLSQIPLQRLGSPQDIAGAVAFLASPLADYISGHVLVVDGGRSVL